MLGIDPPALAEDLARRPRRFGLLDIREAGEAEAGHIPGATVLPRRLIEFRIDALVSARDTPLVVYGVGDGRAELAAATLAERGYGAVQIFAGGLDAWRGAGFPVETGVNVPSKRFGERVLEEDRVPWIAPDELRRLQGSGRPIEQWDVRTPGEYARATIPGSRNVPGVEIASEAARVAGSDTLVVVHCAGRTRSIIAARTLQLLGVGNVVALQNGTMGWRLSGRGRGLVPGDATAVGPEPRPAAEPDGRAAALLAASGADLWTPGALGDALARRARENLVVIDVRGERDHGRLRVPGSVSCPGGQLLQATDDVIAVETTRIVLVDDGDARAAVTASWLRRMGLPHVGVLAGGLPAWRDAGGPTATGNPDPDLPGFSALRDAIPAVAPAALADEPRIVLDVGTSRAFRAGHVPGATWLPRGWLELRIGEVASLEDEIVVTATDDRQAVLAAATLVRLGFRRVSRLLGGQAGWAGAGRPLETATTLPLRIPPDVVDPPYAKGEAGMRRYLEWEVALTEGP